ncbi:MAG TPA: SulP family inorganic anion transporter [Actinomycetes bacterium]|nr:SulP family inorganic anion transporter [Actinomycetes bacterium]
MSPTAGVRSAAERVVALLPTRADLRAARRQPRRDVLAGVTVALVALPLALAFGATSGLGAEAGLVTAVVAGLLAAVFGGSNFQISGPTGAMTVVLVPIAATFGAPGVLMVGVMAGLILIGLAVAQAGRYVRLIPLPVIEGFTVGIAIVIALQQVPATLGVSGEGEKVTAVAISAITSWFDAPIWAPLLTAGAVAAVILLTARLRPGFPISLIAVAAAAVVVNRLDLDVAVIGGLPAGLPIPSLPDFPLSQLSSLVVPAFAVAALAALESLLSATVADAMSVGERHDSDRELFGQGIANVFAPLFGGIPATGAIARTAVNVRAGAHSRLSAVTQSVVLLLVVSIGAALVEDIPLAALAGVLIATTVQMVEVSSLKALWRSTRGDAFVLVATAACTVLLDLVAAVVIGLILAGAYALRQVARAARIDETPIHDESHTDEEVALLKEHIVAYRLEGALFFGAAHSFLLDLSEVSDVRVVILRMSRITTLDATGAAVLADTIQRLEGRKITVLLSGVRPEHDHLLRRLKVYDALTHEDHVFATTPQAIEHGRDHVHRHALLHEQVAP